MEREIKFKAWDKRFKCMIDELPNDYSLGFDGKIYLDGKESTEFIIIEFTGLKDRNGKEIYEGDIVKAWFGTHMRGGKSTKSKYFNCEVIFFKGEFCFRWPKNLGNYRFGESLDDAEVIGNIFENTELLKEQAE